MENINVTHIQSLDISGLSNIRVTTSGRLMVLTTLPNDKSNYEKGMRRAMQKIAASCGRVFGADVGYEDLPDLVESIVRSKKESSKSTKLVKVEESIFDLKEEFEKGELYRVYAHHGDEPMCGVIDSEFSLIQAADRSNVYRQVEIDWGSELREALELTSHRPLGTGSVRVGDSDLTNDEFIALCHKVAELTDKPE